VRAGCWVAEMLPGAGPCDGRLVKAHLIPKQRIRTETCARMHRELGRRWPLQPSEKALLYSILWDGRVWVPVCGGPTGIGGHHGMFDGQQLEVLRSMVPEACEEFAREHELVWSLDRDYGVAGVRGETPVGAVPLDPVGHAQARQRRR
jgi:hypothetical protein